MMTTLAFSSWAMNYTTGDGSIAGDVNGDGVVNVADVSALIDLLMASDYNSSGDVNGDYEINIADINSLIDMILNAGYVDPHNSGYWVFVPDKDGQPVWWELSPNEHGFYLTEISLDNPIFGEEWDPVTYERNTVPLHIMIDGVMFGPENDCQVPYLGTTLDNPLIPSNNGFAIIIGYDYYVGIVDVEGNKYLYITQAGFVSN